MEARDKGSAGRVCLVVALPAEAAPLIDGFGLRPAGGSHGKLEGTAAGGRSPRVFCDAATQTWLVISGVGREAATAAVSSLPEAPGAAWLNLGVAGHRDTRLGTPVLAHRVVDDTTGRAWYPPLLFTPPVETLGVRTVDRACLDYPTPDAYEMEAAGFYAAASRRSGHELVHCFKVISDNHANPASRLTAARVTDLVARNLESIGEVVEALRELSTDQALEHVRRTEPPGLVSLRGTVRLSTTQRRQLRRLLRRFAALHSGTDVLDWLGPQHPKLDAGRIIARLEAHVDEAPPRFEQPGASVPRDAP